MKTPVLLLLLLLLLIPVHRTEGAAAEDPAQVFTLDVKDADIRDVLRLIADQLGLNVIVGEGVDARITVKFADMSLENALQAVLHNSGYYFERRDNVIQVFSEKIMETRTYPIQYASAAEVEQIVKGVFPDVTTQVIARNNSLLLTADRITHDKVAKLVQDVDQLTSQVRITAQVVEITLDDQNQLGIEFTGKEGKAGLSFTDPQSTVAQSLNTLLTYGTLNAGEFAATLNAITTSSNSKLLNNPSVVTQDNHEAEITVTNEHPYQEYFQPSSGSINSAGMYQVQYKKSVIQLKVTPHITTGDAITLDIYARVDKLIGQLVQYQAPGVSTRETSTRVVVPNNHTVVIGGLISDTREQEEGRVPFLGSLPLVGGFFRHHSSKTVRSELLVFITPDVIDSAREQDFSREKVQELEGEFQRKLGSQYHEE